MRKRTGDAVVISRLAFIAAGDGTGFIVPEVHMDDFGVVGVCFGDYAETNHVCGIDDRAQFLVQFPNHTLQGRFAGLDMTTERDETTGAAPISGALLQQKLAIPGQYDTIAAYIVENDVGSILAGSTTRIAFMWSL